MQRTAELHSSGAVEGHLCLWISAFSLFPSSTAPVTPASLVWREGTIYMLPSAPLRGNQAVALMGILPATSSLSIPCPHTANFLEHPLHLGCQVFGMEHFGGVFGHLLCHMVSVVVSDEACDLARHFSCLCLSFVCLRRSVGVGVAGCRFWHGGVHKTTHLCPSE